MLSVAVTKQEHEIFTRGWQKAVGYLNMRNPLNTLTATVDDLWKAAQQIYADYPALLEAARKQLGR